MGPLRHLALVLMICVQSAHTSPLEEADAAQARGDLAAALAGYQQLAEQDDPEALTRLAALHQKGEGVPRDPVQAAALYARAATAGNAEAQFNLGNMYLMGEGVPQDDDWAFTWYRQAALQGHELAQKNVNEFYRAAGITPPTLTGPAAPLRPAAVPEGTATTLPPAAPGPGPAGGARNPADAADEDTSFTPEAVVGTVPETLSRDELTAIEFARAHGIHLDGLDSAMAQGAPPTPLPPAPLPPEVLPPPAADPTSSLPGAEVPMPQASPNPARDYTGLTKGELEVLADAGDARAYLALAQRARLAGGEDEARMWLDKATVSDDPEVMFALGEACLAGKTPDEAAAITWFRSAARRGHPGALKALEAIYQQAGIPMPPLAP